MDENREFERIKPASIAPQAVDTPAPSRRKKTKSSALALVGIVLLFVALLAVFLWLPGSSQKADGGPAQSVDAQPTGTDAGNSAESPAGTVKATEPLDAETGLANRQRAQDLLDQLTALQQTLTEKTVQLWASEEFDAIEQAKQTGKEDFDQRRYVKAAEIWDQAIAKANALIEQANTVFAKAMARGQKALDENESSTAIGAFELAVAVESDNAAAKKGLARAQVLDEVVATLRNAGNLEKDGDLEASLEAYEKALALDSETSAAAAGVARLNAAILARDFAAAMSRGVGALEAGDYATAKAEFLSADKLKPGNADVKRGLKRAKEGLQNTEIARRKRTAEQLEANEQWAKALLQYDKILQLDPSLQFAKFGKLKTGARAKLDSGLQNHLDEPSKLSVGSRRDNAEYWISEARKINNPGTRLRQQITQLEKLVADWSRPIPVTLLSDNKTRLIFYQVGQYPPFDRLQFQLTPGEYTALGRCTGYRDSHHVFTVPVNASTVGPIRITCTETF